ncbi:MULTISPECIES: flagellar biosynthesis regulator FlaF [Sphingomonas]|uniref:Flagellar protein FlaF n=1 Tax=Sphingomonas kyeonggiensis TaxID=1268553 RepID=A0A7W7K3L7_9SPHN|nr:MULTISPECIES: flagellar biosynthesis regulator FlaF [Sphingomonas]MBB4840102.1 flagellar protein FlaF [Sphingomonas kyeonggiensis]WHU04734.1 flagellar biosynthesis regulator FlaF [Sphingomonas sp. NIBR02145]
MTLSAYQAARARAETPRSAELRLLGEITGEMMDAEERGAKGALLMPSLHRNREMWHAFTTDCNDPNNGLPRDLRAQIVSLGLWVDRYTSDVIAGRERIRELIEVNRMIIEGLRVPQRVAA